LAIGLAVRIRIHIGFSFFWGRRNLAVLKEVRFLSEADNAKLNHADRMSPADPKPTSFASQSNDHQQAKPREDAPH
jgi:hypothetical protein